MNGFTKEGRIIIHTLLTRVASNSNNGDFGSNKFFRGARKSFVARNAGNCPKTLPRKKNTHKRVYFLLTNKPEYCTINMLNIGAGALAINLLGCFTCRKQNILR